MNKNNFSKNIVMQNDKCCLSCIGGDILIFSVKDLLNDLPGKFNIVKCSVCGLIRTNPRPNPETIKYYYPDDYGPYLGSIVQNNAKDSAPISKVFKKYLKLIFKFNDMTLPMVTPGRLLEIGCASGSYLNQMAKKGWQVNGIEFSLKAAVAARELGYSVHAGPLETASHPHESFDLILGWMVLEHLHNPVLALKSLRDWSHADTWLVFSVPNAGSLEFHLFKEKWFALQAPTHMYHFSPNTLEKVLTAGGWEIKRIIYHRTITNLSGSIGYVLRDMGLITIGRKFIEFPSSGNRWIHYVVYPVAWLISLFHQSGNITVWAKPSSNK